MKMNEEVRRSCDKWGTEISIARESSRWRWEEGERK